MRKTEEDRATKEDHAFQQSSLKKLSLWAADRATTYYENRSLSVAEVRFLDVHTQNLLPKMLTGG